MIDRKHHIAGMAGLYDDPETLLHAAETVRDAGFTKWDCHTPYPVHGLDQAMGLRESLVPVIALLAGFGGLAASLAAIGYISAIYYPIVVSGKALFSWQAFTPVLFEVFVMSAALATMGSLVVLGKLGRWHSPLHDSGIMGEVTGARFAVVLDARDDRFSEADARALLEQTGCSDIRPLIEFEEEDTGIL